MLIYYDKSYQTSVNRQDATFFLIRQSKTATTIVSKIIKSPESTYKVSKQRYY